MTLNSTLDDCLFPEVNDRNQNNPSSISEEWDLASPLLAQPNDNTTNTQPGSLVQQEEIDDGNKNDPSSIPEDWDLASPLLLQSNHNSTSSQGEGENREGEEDEEVFIPGFESKEYYHTLLATAFPLIFIILVSGSYFFEWSDTVLRVQVDTMLAKEDDEDVSGYKYETGEKLSIDVPLYTDATFQSKLGIFQTSHSNTIVYLIIVSSIVAPIVYMVIQPIIVFATCSISSSLSSPQEIDGFGYGKRCNDFFFNLKRIGQSLSILEFFMKFSMAIIFVNMILNICTSKVKFILGGDYGSVIDDSVDGDNDNHNFNNGDAINVFVVNTPRGGFISFLIGFSLFGIGALFIIRKYRDTVSQRLNILSDHQPHDGIFKHISSNDNELLLALNNDNGTMASPPPSAFHQHQGYFHDCSQSVFSHEDSLIGASSLDDDGYNNRDAIAKRRILNEDRPIFPPYGDETSEELQTPLLSSDGGASKTEDGYNMGIANEENQNKFVWPSILEILQFETGLLSFILLFPISTLPLIRLEYTGLLTTFLDINTLESTTLSLVEIAQSTISSNNDGKDIFGFISIAFFWINVIIVPVITWVSSTCIWFSSCIWRTESEIQSVVLAKMHSVLKIFHPFAFMLPFAISLFVTVSSLQQVTDFLFNQNSTCPMIQNALGLDGNDGSECMRIKGYLLPGSIVLLIQALCTDIFIVLFVSKLD